MKRTAIILSSIILAGALCGCTQNAGTTAETATAETATKGAIVFFNLDRVIEEYDMANDLRSVVETKLNSINEEVNRRGTKLEKDVKAFQDKINKGLLTQSVAEAQSQKLAQQQNEFQNYAAQKQQEMAEEQQVMMNQIADAINTFINEYNAEKKFAMIITTQGDILPAPVVTGDPDLDITEALIAGLNAAYVKSKNQ